MKLRKYLPVVILFTACTGAATVHAASVENSGTTWNEHEYLVVEGDYTWMRRKNFVKSKADIL